MPENPAVVLLRGSGDSLSSVPVSDGNMIVTQEGDMYVDMDTGSGTNRVQINPDDPDAVTVPGGGTLSIDSSLGSGPFVITFDTETLDSAAQSLNVDGTSNEAAAVMTLASIALPNSASYSNYSPLIRTATLTVSGWTNKVQTLNVNGVKASATQIVTVSPKTRSDSIGWGTFGIFCSTQGEGFLSFDCNHTPTYDIQLNIIIQEGHE